MPLLRGHSTIFSLVVCSISLFALVLFHFEKPFFFPSSPSCSFLAIKLNGGFSLFSFLLLLLFPGTFFLLLLPFPLLLSR